MDDPSIADLLETIKVVGVLTKTSAQHETAIIEVFQRLERIEKRLADIESRAA